MALNAMQLNSRDMARARIMLRDQSKGEDPYDLLDDSDDPENADKRRVLIIWCLRSRENPEFTWDDAWELPFDQVYAPDEDEPVEPESVDPSPEVAPSSAPSGSDTSKRKPRAAAPEPSWSTSTP